MNPLLAVLGAYWIAKTPIGTTESPLRASWVMCLWTRMTRHITSVKDNVTRERLRGDSTTGRKMYFFWRKVNSSTVPRDQFNAYEEEDKEEVGSKGASIGGILAPEYVGGGDGWC
ncbi:hypothetical protein GW17_00008296 [Ensete ventricosum]|nr:hypothetical protein GW17_00008296 [Ensete ventricosum]